MAVRVNPISTSKTGYCIIIVEIVYLLFFSIFTNSQGSIVVLIRPLIFEWEL